VLIHHWLLVIRNNIPLPLRIAYLGAITGIIALLLVTVILLLGPLLPPGSQIAFVSGSDGNGEIYLLDVERTIQHNLTRSPVYEGHPFAWSPDGRRIAYLATDSITASNIFAMDADGNNQRNLTNYDANYLSLDWSPDSRHVAFDSDRDGGFEVYVAADCSNESGPCASSVRRMTQNTLREFGPVWSPDGSQILFISYAQSGRSEIRSMNADGSNLHTFSYPTIPLGSLVLSPDNENIVFTSQNQGTYELYTLDAGCVWRAAAADNPVARPCQDTLRDVTEHPADDWLPSWSPDSQEIVFLSWRDGNTEIYRLNLASRALHRLTDHPADDRDPAWSPDGQWIVFVSNRDSSYDIYLMDIYGDNLRRLTFGGVNSLPAWRP
jgi:Tol biopolymer transport system component